VTDPAPPAPDKRAVVSAASAYLIWGLLPLFLKLLSHVPALEVTAHRAIWTVPASAAIAAAMGGLASLKVDARTLRLLCLSALLIGGNWLLYVWAVANERVIEASLGYFINPLLNVALGMALFGERVSRLQLAALGLAVLGVLNQAVAVGTFPFVSLGLALSFGLYGLVKKKAPVSAPAGLFWEATILAGPALLVLGWVAGQGAPAFGGGGWTIVWLLITGPLSAIPLMLFSYGARRLPLTALGLLQYMTPSLQFATGLFFGEPFTAAHAVTFALIWSGLALYTAASWRRGAG
jgi:chloramphenicol-sensitive protein RarD